MTRAFRTAVVLTVTLLVAAPAFAQGGGTDDPTKTPATVVKKPHRTRHRTSSHSSAAHPTQTGTGDAAGTATEAPK